MGLSNDLISQFVKITNDKKEPDKESIVYGEVRQVDYDNKGNVAQAYVQFDGATDLTRTPASSSMNVTEGDRVVVLIKNHSAVVIGNLTSHSANTLKYVDKSKEQDPETGQNEVMSLEVIIANKVSTEELSVVQANINTLAGKQANFQEVTTNQFEAINARIDNLNVGDLSAISATIETLKTDKASVESLNAIDTKIINLGADYASFKETTVDELQTIVANVTSLQTDKLSAKDAAVKYANIDFSNIGEAAIKKILANSGLIENLVVGNGTITGRLVGVTISGNLIEADTIVADKLVVKGEDGVYYKLNTDGVTTEVEQTDYNSLNGSIIKAKSITATKIDVDDLVAFDATIGGFNISDSSLYSGAKSSIHNSTQGIYFGRDGQMNVGDSVNYIKYYKGEDGKYKVAISADEITFSNGTKTVDSLANDVNTLTSQVKVTYDDDNSPILNLISGSEAVQIKITNSGVDIYENGQLSTHISNRMLNIDRVYATKELQIGPFVLAERTNGNVGIKWTGGGNG